MARKSKRCVLLNQTVVKALAAPESGRVYVYDETQANLAICISATGGKVWYWTGRLRGQYVRICLGNWPEIPVERARNEAKRISGESAEGKIPTSKRRTLKRDITLGDAFLKWFTIWSKPRKKTWQRDESRFDRFFAEWKHRRLSSITTIEIQELQASVAATAGKSSANGMLELLRSIINFATKHMNWDHRDPSKPLEKFRIHDRDRFLSEDELPRFFAAVQKLRRQTARDFFLLCLFTGARRSNVQQMRWQEIHMERRTWTIPHVKSKSGESFTVPLSDPAMEILLRRKRTAKGEFVLPGNGKSGNYDAPKGSWQQILKTSGIKNLRIHDLRRTYGSYQAMTGASLLTIAKSLGHTSTAATKVYARLQVEATRSSIDAAMSKMMGSNQENQKSEEN